MTLQCFYNKEHFKAWKKVGAVSTVVGYTTNFAMISAYHH